MNEYSILVHLLTRNSSESVKNSNVDPKIKSPAKYKTIKIGAVESDIHKALSLTGRNAKIQFNQLLSEFSRVIQPFGMVIKQNPFDKHWFLTQNSEIHEFFKANPFSNKSRLAATLFTIISLCFIHSGSVDIQTIQKIRKKKDIQTDLTELVQQGFILLDENNVSIHPNLGYYIDLDQFLVMLEQNSQKSVLKEE
jgi:hypothetical protein